jgi:hypothetical protein
VSSGPTVTIDDARSRRGGRSLLEFVAVLLLGVATVATAWCGYQASRWNGEETDQYRAAGFANVESSRLFGLATEIIAYDAGVTAQYARAVAEGDTDLQEFIKDKLVRPAFRPQLEQWEADRASGAEPTNLFENQEYLDSQFAQSDAKQAEVVAAQTLSAEAGDTADEYLLTTLLTASALFFAGVTTSFKKRTAQMLLLSLAGASLAYVAIRLVDLPVI